MLLPHMVVKGKVGSIPVQCYCLSLHIKSIEIACGISGRVGRVHVLAVLKMVKADLVRVEQLLCSFRAKITRSWPSVYDPFLGPVKT